MLVNWSGGEVPELVFNLNLKDEKQKKKKEKEKAMGDRAWGKPKEREKVMLRTGEADSKKGRQIGKGSQEQRARECGQRVRSKCGEGSRQRERSAGTHTSQCHLITLGALGGC